MYLKTNVLVEKDFFIGRLFRIFANSDSNLINTIKCQLKIRYFKFLPGLAIVCVVTVASSLTSIPPGGLVFTPTCLFTSKLATYGQ